MQNNLHVSLIIYKYILNGTMVPSMYFNHHHNTKASNLDHHRLVKTTARRRCGCTLLGNDGDIAQAGLWRLCKTP